MTTIAIVGADGAGKTTIAQMIERANPQAVRYLYLGASIESGNYRLPTSRLILNLKLRAYRKKAARKGITDPKYISTHHMAHREVKYGLLGSWLQMANRLMEGAYRQTIAALFQVRGWTVICDRHLYVDGLVIRKSPRLVDRFYLWALTHLFPKPDLVVFLDAPPETLQARKAEGTVERLHEWRETYLRAGELLPNFVIVDASQPLPSVYAAVNRRIVEATSLDLDFTYTATRP
jgi:thymidylate kinase